MGSLLAGWLGEAGHGLLDLIYPPRCVVCREPGSERFCAVCRGTIVLDEPPLARGSALAGRACVGVYAGPLREAVKQLKYHDRRALAIDLGRLMADRLETLREKWQPDALVPVPIHWHRRQERGYNQAELLATAISEQCRLPVRAAVERIRDTLPQVDLNRERRYPNVQGAFAPCAGVAPGRRSVLIDDVQTTGATLEEAARALRAAGAHMVYALTLCGEGMGRRS